MQTLLRTTNNLLDHDLYWSLNNLTQAVSRGLIPRKESCFICHRNFTKIGEDEAVVVFRYQIIYLYLYLFELLFLLVNVLFGLFGRHCSILRNKPDYDFCG